MVKKVIGLFIVVVSVLGFTLNVNAADTLQSLIDNATDGAVITLEDNYTEDIEVAADKNVTIDLNSYTLTGATSHTIVNKGKLTIKGTGIITNTINGKAPLLNEGEVLIESGTLKRNDVAGNSYYVIENHGTMTINGGEITVDGGSSSLIDNGWFHPELNTTGKLSTLIINGGTFKITNNNKYIKNDDFGVMEINNGSFSMVKPSSAIIANVGSAEGSESVTVNGGDFSYTGTNYVVWDYIKQTTNKQTVTVSGGTFKTTEASAKVTNAEIDETLEYVEDENGNLVVDVKSADYTKVDEAIAKANKINKDIYTTKSVKALNEAVKAVEKGLDITKQTEVDNMAKAIEDAYAKLAKLADYSKVDEAAAKASNIDASKYTEASYEELINAMSKVEDDMDESKQATVDGWAEAILEAIDNLVLITPAKEEEVPKTFDGISNYVGLSLISLLGLGLSVKALVKKED